MGSLEGGYLILKAKLCLEAVDGASGKLIALHGRALADRMVDWVATPLKNGEMLKRRRSECGREGSSADNRRAASEIEH